MHPVPQELEESGHLSPGRPADPEQNRDSVRQREQRGRPVGQQSYHGAKHRAAKVQDVSGDLLFCNDRHS